VEGSARTATRSNREVLNTVLVTPLLVGACNGVLESGGVGGVTGDGNADVLKLLFFVCFFDFYLYNTTKFRANQVKKGVPLAKILTSYNLYGILIKNKEQL